MEIITILEANTRKAHQTDWYIFLCVQKYMVEEYFDWLDLSIDLKTRSLVGRGEVIVADERHRVLLYYSPFYHHRDNRVFIDDKTIKYHRDNHLYPDASLCLYHPVIDRPAIQIIPLFKMIPWITEWVIFYKYWKKYGVWLAKEIKH